MAPFTEDSASGETHVVPKDSLAPVEMVDRPISRDDWGSDFWRNFRGLKERKRERPSIYWCTEKGPIKKRVFDDPRRYPFFDTLDWTLVPKATKKNMPPAECHLLSLPKELRLEIWSHVLTDTSLPRVTLEVDRAPQAPSKTSLRFPHPCIRTTIRPTRTTPISIDILATNNFIYQEALPVLYHSVRFAVLDLQGIFMPFLNTFSSFALSHIRFIKLRIPTMVYETDSFANPVNYSTLLVNWAITCAQVAKIESLREVEVEGYEPLFASKRIRDGILNPLLKIKAKKLFGLDIDAEAQEALREAETALRNQAELRRRRTLSEAAERAQNEILKEVQLQKEKERDLNAFWIHTLTPKISEAQIERDIESVSGLRRFEQELREHEQSNAVTEDESRGEGDLDLGEWEVVVLGERGDVAKVSATEDLETTDDEDAWTNAGSTLVESKSQESFV